MFTYAFEHWDHARAELEARSVSIPYECLAKPDDETVSACTYALEGKARYRGTCQDGSQPRGDHIVGALVDADTTALSDPRATRDRPSDACASIDED